MKHIDQAALDRWSQVDQDIAAQDQVQLGERRVARQVLPREDAQIADRLVNAKVSVRPVEEAPDPFG